MERDWRKGVSIEKGKHFASFLLAPFLGKIYFICVVEAPKSWAQLQLFAGNFSTCAVIKTKVNGLLVEAFEMSSWMNKTWWNICLEWKVRRNEDWLLQKQDSAGDGVVCGLSQSSWHRKWFDTAENLKRDCEYWKSSGNQPQMRQRKRFLSQNQWRVTPGTQSAAVSHPIWFCCSVLDVSFCFSWSFPVQLLWCSDI